MRQVSGRSITIEQAADLLERSSKTKETRAGEIKATWLNDDDKEVILIHGIGDKFLLLSC